MTYEDMLVQIILAGWECRQDEEGWIMAVRDGNGDYLFFPKNGDTQDKCHIKNGEFVSQLYPLDEPLPPTCPWPSSGGWLPELYARLTLLELL